MHGGCTGWAHRTGVGIVTKGPTPNRALAAILDEGRVSRKGLARRVRDLARRDDKHLATDHVSVKRWLDGGQPQPDTARYVAAALSEVLRRAVTPTALGFTATLGSAGTAGTVLHGQVAYAPDVETAAGALADVANADLEGNALHQLNGWDEHAAPGVVTGYLFGDVGQGESTADGPPLDASAIRLTTARLMDLDFQVGGGHVRELLLYYFRSQVMPLLDALRPTGRRRDLFSAVAELAQMLGWSAYDAGRHGAAQRYFVHGLRLARAAEDDLLGARILSNLSHQANYLGDVQNAVQLARAAQSAASAGASPVTSSMLLAMEARALASLGDLRGCAGALDRADEALDRGGRGDDPDWIRYFDRAELAGEAAHCYRDLRRPGETRQFSALAVADASTPPRTRAFINMVTAMGALHEGLLDEAVEVARQAVQLAGPLKSSRYRRYVTDFVQTAADLHPQDSRIVELTVFTARVVEA